MKVSKKDEKLARAILEAQLRMIGFPSDRIHERVNEAWPGCLYQAMNINLMLRNIDNAHLDGVTDKKAIETWQSNE